MRNVQENAPNLNEKFNNKRQNIVCEDLDSFPRGGLCFRPFRNLEVWNWVFVTPRDGCNNGKCQKVKSTCQV